MNVFIQPDKEFSFLHHIRGDVDDDPNAPFRTNQYKNIWFWKVWSGKGTCIAQEPLESSIRPCPRATLQGHLGGCGGLVVRPCLQGWNVPGSETDPTEDPSCMWAYCTLNLASWVRRPPAGVVQKFGRVVPDQVSSSSSGGRGGLVVRSWLWGWRFQVQNPIPLKIRRVWGLLHVKSYVVAKRSPVGVEVLRGGASSCVVLII
ncbi:hypothetical protein AVEN_8459-1 [Araneus ventricosus]|uniref:Uncharacterized protein n=1 Tax=Araneus ventricosus TaxID=182803 RepID=A0A4Y2ETS1_ARAVE|nr:hypothetical protein AVEN_8459-1 [Araneus ventricosus]